MGRKIKKSNHKKKRRGLKRSMWITLFLGITFSYFIWLIWQKLTDIIGDGWIVLGITGGIVFFGILLGYFSINKVVNKFVE